jgi:uncharacterized protein with PIN domain
VPADGSRISVYPVFEAFDIGSLSRVRPEPLREPRFVLDVHLGRLCAYLRMAGFDTLYSTDAADDELAWVASREHRILLTRDQGLLKRRLVTHGHWMRATNPRAQFEEVVRRFDLTRRIRPFTRCLRCNAPLEPVPPAAVAHRVPVRVRQTPRDYRQCGGCKGVYWEGTHHARMRAMLAALAPPDDA